MSRLSLTALLVSAISVSAPMSSSAQTFPSDLPMAIVCWSDKTQRWVVGYLEIVNEDGSAIYGRGDLSATLGASRIVELPSNRRAVLDCYGKSLDELRASGQVIELRLSE